MSSNPNPYYKPPMIKNMFIMDKYNLEYKSNHIVISLDVPCEMNYRIKRTREYYAFKQYCKNFGIDFIFQQNVDDPTHLEYIITIPFGKFLEVEASDYYHKFIKEFLRLTKRSESMNIISETMWRDADLYKPRPDATILFIDDCGNAHRGIYTGDKVISSGITEMSTETTVSDTIETRKIEFEAVLTTYEWSQIIYWCYASQIEDVLVK